MSKRREPKFAGGMPARHNDPHVYRLPDRVSRLEHTVENIVAHFATKNDLSEVYRKLDTKMEKGFGELRTEIKASANRLLWGGLGFAAVLFVGLAGLLYSNQSGINASLDRMDRRIEASEQARDRRFEEMNRAMDRRFEQIDRRFERIEQALFVPAKQAEQAAD